MSGTNGEVVGICRFMIARRALYASAALYAPAAAFFVFFAVLAFGIAFAGFAFILPLAFLPPMPARAFSSSIAAAMVRASTCVPFGTEAFVVPSVTYGP